MAELLYLKHFGLGCAPFSIAPDPSFLYLSDQHREALAHLLWGLGSDGGFVVLTGEVGTGKTTLSRCLLDRIPADTDLAFIINPRLSNRELLATICEELGDPPAALPASDKRLVDRINHRLLAAHARGRRTVLVIDEAQNLSRPVLEQIRLLTNLETNKRKLLQVILIGQPELDTMLRRADLRQLAQRVTARFHLQPLSRDDLAACVTHRLELAGARAHIFTRAALARLHRLSGGIPRVANLIADRALLGAYARDDARVGWSVVGQAAREVRGQGATASWAAARAPRLAAAALLASVLLGGGLALLDADTFGAQLAGVTAALAPDTARETPAPSTIAPTADDLPVEPRMPLAAIADPALPSAGDAFTAEIMPTRPVDPTDDAQVDGTVALIWDSNDTDSMRTALGRVLERWFVPLELGPNAAPCNQLSRVGLGCLELATDWSELAALDLPAVLHLESDSSGLQEVALLTIRGDRAQLATTDAPRWVSRRELERRWLGDATLIWQLPPGDGRVLSRGSRGEDVRWLRQQLAEAGHRAPGRADEFNANLEAAVREFQLRSNLVADGIAGPMTWILLQREAGTGIPSLTAADGR